jgi:hypothetical protein
LGLIFHTAKTNEKKRKAVSVKSHIEL